MTSPGTIKHNAMLGSKWCDSGAFIHRIGLSGVEGGC